MSRRPYGPAAWLVDDLTDPAAWADSLRAMDVPGVVEIVPAESTVVVRCTRERHVDIGHVLDMVVPASRTEASEQPVTIDVNDVVECIATEADLRAAALEGGEHDVCGSPIVLTGGEVEVTTDLTLTSVLQGNAVIDACRLLVDPLGLDLDVVSTEIRDANGRRRDDR